MFPAEKVIVETVEKGQKSLRYVFCQKFCVLLLSELFDIKPTKYHKNHVRIY